MTYTHTPVAFWPRSRAELKSAVDICLKQFPKSDCSNGPHGPIGQWDVSRVADMSRVFSFAREFRGDISKWDVSNARDMSGMFRGAKTFDRDLSKWDVSRVTTMGSMFRGARSFNGDVSTWDVSRVINMDNMFQDAILFTRQLCGAAWVNSQVCAFN